MVLNSRLSVTFVLIAITIMGVKSVDAYDFDYSKPIVYQFPIVQSDAKKLDYTVALMGFLSSQYSQKIKATHVQAEFLWNFNWSQDYLGAGSNYYQKQFSIMLLGGMVRAEGSSFQVIAATLCHEFGHYLGGVPRQRIEDKVNGDWSSSEGQSDWFAATDCLPRVYDYFNKVRPSFLEIDYEAESKELCVNSVIHSLDDQRRCQWVMSAGANFTDFLHYYFDRNTERATLLKTAQEVPDETLHSAYPTAQCRLDTIKSGALCALGNKSSCSRPRCWFNPAK